MIIIILLNFLCIMQNNIMIWLLSIINFINGVTYVYFLNSKNIGFTIVTTIIIFLLSIYFIVKKRELVTKRIHLKITITIVFFFILYFGYDINLIYSIFLSISLFIEAIAPFPYKPYPYSRLVDTDEGIS